MFSGLQNSWHRLCSERIEHLFATDKKRERKFSLERMSFLIDYSKTHLDREARDQLLRLCDSVDLADHILNLFSGKRINNSENRPVLHHLLRNSHQSSVLIDGHDPGPQVQSTLMDMKDLYKAIKGTVRLGSGGRFRDAVNIGIGGSDLGPAMVTEALRPYHEGLKCHFVANVDGANIHDVLKKLNAKTTLLIISSKTFSTIETVENAKTALEWLSRYGGNPSQQVIAVTAAPNRAQEFGIEDRNIFCFADWVGGRYSVWGPTGLPVMLAIGPANFAQFLRGAAEIDRHFQSTNWEFNLPVVLALLDIWHHQICRHPTRAVLPYDQRLALFPSFLQQLEMESNGKGVMADGSPLDQPAAPVIWGGVGTNSQHAFFQLLQQGGQVVPCEFLIAANGHEEALRHHHELLISNCLAQAHSLMVGRNLDETRAQLLAQGLAADACEQQSQHRIFIGNRPSVTIMYPKLTPKMLGRLIAIYEHRVFVEGVFLGINSFDQWGVELGKEVARDIHDKLCVSSASCGDDRGMSVLMKFLRQHRPVN